MASAPRMLIVNADDFGLSAGVNRGIIEAYERGVVTSASLMVRGAAALAAANYARVNGWLSIGLHIDLAEWAYRNGAWEPLYQVVDLDNATAVDAEVRRQLASFIGLMGRPPSHFDSHQHTHRKEPLRSIAARLAKELNVSLRHFSSVQYCGHFYGQTTTGEPLPQAISVESLLTILGQLSGGTTELVCHPGFAEELPTMYRRERVRELATLCDPRVRAALMEHSIELVGFHEVL